MTKKLSTDRQRWVDETLARMSLPEKAGQMLIADFPAVFTNAEHENLQRIQQLISEHHIGAVILAGGSLLDIAALTNRLQQRARIPLLINADLESGCMFWHPWKRVRGRTPDLPAELTGGGTALPRFMAIGATRNEDHAYQAGFIAASEMRAIGIHWTNSPVLDVNSNPLNPIVNIRSFGEQPALVAKLGAAYVRGCQDAGVIATMKHFPGHGDTQEDTHINLPAISSDWSRLEAVELVPFKAAIGAGIKAAMTAHIALPQIDPTRLPATLSPVIISEMLRGRLGFDGLIITDAMTMQAISDHFGADEAPIMAVKAGVDMLLMPADCTRTHRRLCEAVERGEIAPERVDRAVRRILHAKAELKLHQDRLVSLERVFETVNQPDSQQLAEKMANDAITLLEHDGHTLPLISTPQRILEIVVTNAALAEEGATLHRALMSQGHHCEFMSLSQNNDASQLIARFPHFDLLLLEIHFIVGGWRGELRLPPAVSELIERANQLGKPVVVLAFGDPYVFQFLPPMAASLCAYGSGVLMEQAMARALMGEIEIKGRLPVTIPQRFACGFGLTL